MRKILKIGSRRMLLVAIFMTLVMAPVVQAAGEGGEAGPDGIGLTFLWIAVILVIAKMSGLIERYGQPAVLGELVAGVILGNLILIGVPIFEPVKENQIIHFLAELGVVILLFQIGLESDIKEMRRVGVRAFIVAVVGVITPFALGTYLVGPLLLPGLSFQAYLFIGATLTATSVGITARVFRDLGTLQSPEARIVLGAAVIDDVLGLIVLAVVSALVTSGTISVGAVSWILAKAVFFLVGTIVLGLLFAGRIGAGFSKIQAGIGMKFTLAISLGLVFAYLAEAIGLAPIVGAFAAGLVLDPVHFRGFKDPEIIDDLKTALKDTSPELKQPITKVIEAHSHRHVEELIEPVGHFLIPIFFVLTGMTVRLETLFNLPILLVAIGLTVVAVVGKLVAGWVAGDVRKSIVGWGMVPRGEVGLIFATIGRSLGVVSDAVFSAIVIMVIFTTLLTPPVLTLLLKWKEKETVIVEQEALISP